MVFNARKQFIFAGDAYPRHYISKLDKGDYILKLQVWLRTCQNLHVYYREVHASTKYK